MANVVRVQLPSYGTVVGTSKGEVEHFLGIPYASVTERWTKPRKAGPFPGGEHDGTHYGPICPQPKTPMSMTQVAVPSHPPDPDLPEDEFACLNLNIIRPSNTQGKLPVMVWIHGGAYTVGKNSELVYEGTEFVSRSKKINQPVIYIAINYRLGFFGFLASQELLEDANNESAGNYGLWDQAAALEFIRETVGAFGGDPDRITLFGESAGSASVHNHLLHGKALFDRAICQSGVANTMGPLPLNSHLHQGAYDALKKQLKVKDLKELRSVPPAELVDAAKELYPGLPVSLSLDDSDLAGGFYPSKTKFNSVPKFCKALMIGYCTNEGIIMAQALATLGSERLGKYLKTSGISAETLKSYGLDDVESKDFNSLIPALIEFQTDSGFKGPAESVKANASPDSLFSYRLERENKWSSSPFSGEAHHTIDLLYLAGIPLHYETEDPVTDKQISEKMIDAWVTFGNGGQPWSPYSNDQAELIIGRDGSFTTVTESVKSHKASLNNMKKEIERNPEAMVSLNAALCNGAIKF